MVIKTPPFKFYHLFLILNNIISNRLEFFFFMLNTFLLIIISYIGLETNKLTSKLFRIFNEKHIVIQNPQIYQTVLFYLFYHFIKTLLYVTNLYIQQNRLEIKSSDERIISYKHILTLDYAQIENYSIAEWQRTMKVESVFKIQCINLSSLITCVFEIFIYYYTLFKINGILSIIILFSLLIYQFYIYQPLIDLETKIKEQQRDLKTDLKQIEIETLEKYDLIKMFKNENYHIGAYIKSQLQFQNLVKPCIYYKCLREWIEQILPPIILSIFILTTLLCKINNLIGIVLILKQLINSFDKFLSNYDTLVKEFPFIYRYFNRLNLKPSIILSDRSALLSNKCKGREIIFNNVTFAYPNRPNQLIFNNLNLTLKRGVLYGLKGNSGCGKSTFLKLLYGLYHPNSGKILIDNIPISLIKLDNLKKNIMLVPQTPSLFQGTLLDNLRYGLINIQDSIFRNECIKFLKLFELYDLIPLLDKPITINNLSGGQCQRIAFIRALIANRPFLILDEITSNLDITNTQKVIKIIKYIHKYTKKTILLISHIQEHLSITDQIIILS